MLFAFLRPERVSADPWLAFGAAGFAIAVVMTCSQLPRWAYVRYLHARGLLQALPRGERFMLMRADFWTLAFACVCVILGFITGVRPGYAYGIIGVLVLNRAVRMRAEEDRGQLQPWRLDLAGMAALLTVALASRVAYSWLHARHDEVASHFVEESWALGSETVALALIPLQFLPGRSLSRWNRIIWVSLWLSALFLYIQSITPAKLGSGPLVVGLTLLVYAGLTIGFWAYFRYRHDEATCESCRTMAHELAFAS